MQLLNDFDYILMQCMQQMQVTQVAKTIGALPLTMTSGFSNLLHIPKGKVKRGQVLLSYILHKFSVKRLPKTNNDYH